MSIAEEVRRTITEAMKAKDSVRLDVARMTQAAFKNREIEKKAPLEEGDAQKIVATLIKQRKEAFEQFQNGGREDLAQKEAEEQGFLESLLPPPLSEDEIVAVVDRVIADTGASAAQDFGKVMKPVMAELGTRADGKLVKDLIQKKLT